MYTSGVTCETVTLSSPPPPPSSSSAPPPSSSSSGNLAQTSSPGELSRASTITGKTKATTQATITASQSLVSLDNDSNTIAGDGAERDTDAIILTPKDLLSMDLGVLSDLDARFVEWLAVAEELSVPEEGPGPAGQTGTGSGAGAGAGPRSKRRVMVKRNWKDVVGVLLGLN